MLDYEAELALIINAENGESARSTDESENCLQKDLDEANKKVDFYQAYNKRLISQIHRLVYSLSHEKSARKKAEDELEIYKEEIANISQKIGEH